MEISLLDQPSIRLRQGDALEMSPKMLGAFYTDSVVADFLVWWAIRKRSDTVLDPSFGGGVFLRAAAKAIRKRHGNPADQVFGVEIDGLICKQISEKLDEEFGLSNDNCSRADFFEVEAKERTHDAVIGNPPFIRFHNFSGDGRERALARAASEGVKLSRLVSSWAPFVVHSSAMLRNGGRLAMVLPAELTYAVYAKPVLEYLGKQFGSITVITFQTRLFQNLSEDTVLLLADFKGSHTSKLNVVHLDNGGKLSEIQRGNAELLLRSEQIEIKGVVADEVRFNAYNVPPKVRDLYASLAASDETFALGDAVKIVNGYVTGANGFFHISPQAARAMKLPKNNLLRSVNRARALRGLTFHSEDWESSITSKDSSFLLYVKNPSSSVPLQKYLEAGVRQGVSKSYKCRNRTPWYAVPQVVQPDAFLTYTSGGASKLVANDASAVAPNTLLTLELRSDSRYTAHDLAALWNTSFTMLSAEIEGHSLGGGMLKLEPREARKVRLFAGAGELLANYRAELDQLLRANRADEARRLGDRMLIDMGLDRSDCKLLASAYEELRSKRMGKGSNGSY